MVKNVSTAAVDLLASGALVPLTPDYGTPEMELGEVVRAHWGIENSLHWVLDVTMNEDQNRSRKDNGPQNLALLRRWALNAFKLEGSKGSIKGKLKTDRRE